MTEQYDGPERRNTRHDQLVSSIIDAIREQYTPACLNEDEQHWVRMAIKDQANRAALRKAVIEKSLAGLVWSAIVGLGYLFLDYLRAHGFK